MWYIELDDERVWVCKRPDYLFLDSKWIFKRGARSNANAQALIAPADNNNLSNILSFLLLLFLYLDDEKDDETSPRKMAVLIFQCERSTHVYIVSFFLWKKKKKKKRKERKEKGEV